MNRIPRSVAESYLQEQVNEIFERLKVLERKANVKRPAEMARPLTTKDFTENFNLLHLAYDCDLTQPRNPDNVPCGLYLVEYNAVRVPAIKAAEGAWYNLCWLPFADKITACYPLTPASLQVYAKE